jgi:hypothetical protein
MLTAMMIILKITIIYASSPLFLPRKALIRAGTPYTAEMLGGICLNKLDKIKIGLL